MRALTEYEVAVFDCDGVIFDSNPIKTGAFRVALAAYPSDLVDRFVAYHQTHGGVSRYVKLRHFFETFVEIEDVEARLKTALEVFTRTARARLATVEMLPGFWELLADWSVPAYIASGADQRELRDVFALREMTDRFVEICGSPAPKESHLERLGAAGKLSGPSVFFGDAQKDMDVAEAAGMDFIYIGAASDWTAGPEVCAARGHRVLTDFRPLLAEI